jgi:hypothetical protein
MSDARARLRAAHDGERSAWNETETTRAALGRAVAMVAEIGAERDALLDVERLESRAGASGLVALLKAGTMRDPIGASPTAVEAKMKRAIVEDRLSRASDAREALEAEHEAALAAHAACKAEVAAAIAAVLDAEIVATISHVREIVEHAQAAVRGLNAALHSAGTFDAGRPPHWRSEAWVVGNMIRSFPSLLDGFGDPEAWNTFRRALVVDADAAAPSIL